MHIFPLFRVPSCGILLQFSFYLSNLLIRVAEEDNRALEEDIIQSLGKYFVALKIAHIEFESRTNPSLGPLRTLSNSIKVIRDDSGRAIRAAGTSLDIT